jgi:hypothetical protein
MAAQKVKGAEARAPRPAATAPCSQVSGEIWISTRRFCALPAAVLFDAIGWPSP